MKSPIGKLLVRSLIVIFDEPVSAAVGDVSGHSNRRRECPLFGVTADVARLASRPNDPVSLADFRNVTRLVPRRVIPLRQQHNRVRVEALILQRINAADRFALDEIDDGDRAVAHSRQIE